MLKWLSYPLDINGPRPPSIPPPALNNFLNIEKDGASVQHLELYSHTGTHVDTSAHVYRDGVHITDFEPCELTFKRPKAINLCLSDDAVVICEDIEPFIKDIKETDFLIICFGLAGIRKKNPERYIKHSPGMSIKAARYLLDVIPGLRGLGIDAPSVASIAKLDDTMAVHNILLNAAGRKFLIVEEMKLDVDFCGLSEVRLHPWMVKGMHSGPCTVTGVF